VSVLYGALAVLGAAAAWAQLGTRAVAVLSIGVVAMAALLLTAGVLRLEARQRQESL
jgi:hypothetical protein